MQSFSKRGGGGGGGVYKIPRDKSGGKTTRVTWEARGWKVAAAHIQGGGTVRGGECIGWTLHLFWGEGTEQGDTYCDMGVEGNGGWGQIIILVRIMGGKCV